MSLDDLLRTHVWHVSFAVAHAVRLTSTQARMTLEWAIMTVLTIVERPGNDEGVQVSVAWCSNQFIPSSPTRLHTREHAQFVLLLHGFVRQHALHVSRVIAWTLGNPTRARWS